jgi:hypothetical protein
LETICFEKNYKKGKCFEKTRAIIVRDEIERFSAHTLNNNSHDIGFKYSVILWNTGLVVFFLL